MKSFDYFVYTESKYIHAAPRGLDFRGFSLFAPSFVPGRAIQKHIFLDFGTLKTLWTSPCPCRAPQHEPRAPRPTTGTPKNIIIYINTL